jgi:mannose-1-phosphate guanylyltransferase/mannose-6-phosphate isomerase
MSAIYPIILSGGSGTRLWPLSRAKYPKQFIRFSDDQQHSFLQATSTRLPERDGFMPPLVMCNEDHRFLVEDQLAEAGVRPGRIVLEPAARNTAPAIAVAALLLGSADPDAILAVMPSDHVIDDSKAFAATVTVAAQVARTGRLVLLGIEARSPHTGYGYIRRGEPLPGTEGLVFSVDEFREKPDPETARTLVDSGCYYWNSGIFVLHAATFLKELDCHAPEILHAAREALVASTEDLGFLRLDADAYGQAPDISVDYAVMERTAAAAMIPYNSGWSDVGSWSSLWELAPRDEQGNAVTGTTMLEDTRNCYVHGNGRLVSTLGVENLIIVDTPDAVLVSDRSRAQEVGRIVTRLKQSNRWEHDNHLRQYRPWGYFEQLNAGPRFQVKLLHVKPGGRLSMQLHHHRSEHWVVVKGTAKVTRGEEARLVCENESFYISATDWHRLENPGHVPVEIIEVQIGTYLGEDDIIRSEDVYNRAGGEAV